MVRLALYKGRGQIGNAVIRWWTGSPYSHCELVADGWCYSSSVMDKGVRRKLINLDDGKWDQIDLPWADPERVREYFAVSGPRAYGWASLVTSQLLNRGLSIPGQEFCSEWCAAALRLPNPAMYNPKALGEMVKFINSFTEV